MHTDASSPQAHGAAGLSALASRLPSRSRTRASGDRPKCCAAVLALRPARARTLHARLLRRLRPARHRPVQQQQIRCSSGRRTACRGSIAGRLTIGIRAHSQARASAPRRRPWRWALSFALFRAMEGNPHGTAHTQLGRLHLQHRRPPPKDPLFFLLHCNVDRLWAKWQRQNGRFNPAQARLVRHQRQQSRSGTICLTRCGHGTASPEANVHRRRRAARWPRPLPSRAPGLSRACETCWTTRHRSMPASTMGFDYDDVSSNAPLREEMKPWPRSAKLRSGRRRRSQSGAAMAIATNAEKDREAAGRRHGRGAARDF